MQNRVKFVFIFFLASLLMCSCSRDKDRTGKESKKRSDHPDAVALVGDSSLRNDEIMTYVKARSHRGKSSQGLDQALDEMVVAELLYQEAILQKIDQKPEVRQAMRQLLGQKILEEQVSKPALTRQISTAELRQYYDKHQEFYARPEQIRLADIFLAVPADSDEAVFNEKKKEAEEILFQAQSMKSDRFGFSQLIRDCSDKNPKYRLGDTGFFDRSGRPGGIAEELVQAGFFLAENGKIADQIVQTADGFHIIKLVASRQPFSRDFATVSKEIEQRIRKEDLSEKRAVYIASLRKRTKVAIQQDVLDNIRLELTDGRDKDDGTGLAGSSNVPILPGQ